MEMDNLFNLTLDEIWELDNANNLVVALGYYLAEKSGFNSDVEDFSYEEKVFYTAYTLESEVNNGGFSQFFFNSSGKLAKGIVNAFSEIGAAKTAEICRKALSAFEAELPLDDMQRQDMLLEMESEEMDELLWDCDCAFYEYEENLEALNYAYIMKNKAAFS